MKRKITWMILAATLATTGWLGSLSLAGPAKVSAREERRERQKSMKELREEVEELELEVKELRLNLQMLKTMGEMMFDPEHCAMMAIGAIKDDLDLEPKEAIPHLEQVLAQTKTLGLRNAIRLSLKELYEETDQTEKVLKLLKDTVAENDRAAMEQEEEEEAEEEERK